MLAVEQCIHSNAPAVERAIDRLPDAVDFLVEDVCAKPIADAAARQQLVMQDKFLEELKERCAVLKQSGKAMNGAANACIQADSVRAQTDAMRAGTSSGGWTLFAPAANKSAEATSLAAKVLLDLRIQRMNATSTQGPH